MDANGTRFQLLLGRADWGRCRQGGAPPDSVPPLLEELWSGEPSMRPRLAWDEDASEVTLQPRLFHFVAAPRGVPPRLEDRRGAGRDVFGNSYWIGEDQRTIQVQSSGSGTVSRFWPQEPSPVREPLEGAFGPVQPPEPPAPPLLRGMAVTTHHYLVVGTVDPSGLLVFDLHAGGQPLWLLWPPGMAIPFDLAPTPDGGVLVLDQEHPRYWRLDAGFHPLPSGPELTLAAARLDTFQPAHGRYEQRTPARTFPVGVPVARVTSPPEEPPLPIAIEALTDSRVLVLDRSGTESHVLLYEDGVLQGEPVRLELRDFSGDGRHEPTPIVAHDFAFVPAEGEGFLGHLYVVSSEGNQAFAFSVSEVRPGQLRLDALTDYFPMRLFGGKALVAARGRLYYDFPDGFVPLVAQRRPRYEREAILVTPVLDGHTPDCVWHRLFLDGCIPPGTSVRVRSRASNEKPPPVETGVMELDAPWSAEPGFDYLRSDGSELPWVTQARGEHRGTFELLFQNARGRYLQLELTLRGPGNSTPRLRALRAYYPRFSYSERYLPAIYRQEPASASFLERFLANMEGFFTTLEDRIIATRVLFDASNAPPETLDWLAGWFGLVLDPAWDETRRRLLLRHAIDFFQWRGTPRGLRMALRLALDECPDESIFQEDDPLRSPLRIIEHFRAASVTALPQEQASSNSIREVMPRTRWEPSQGGESLARRYREALAAAGLTGGPQRFPLRRPGDEDTAVVWDAFSRAVLGFIPPSSAGDEAQWREFLVRRYRRIGALAGAWGADFEAFSDVPLPSTLPTNARAVEDWYQFSSVVLPLLGAAHRFSVVLPVPAGEDAEQHRARMEQARRLVELEKPAHTVFDVRLYWTLLRVGEARLGVDTLVSLGGRTPELLRAMVLGREHLAEAYLAAGHPQDVADRRILGRDRLVSRPTQGSEPR